MKSLSAALLAAFAFLGACSPPERIDFGHSISAGKDSILLRGPIDQGTYHAFKAAADGGVKTLIIHSSQGGSVWAAEAIARDLRAGGFTTVVRGECLSACVSIAAGGVNRFAERSARYGVHRPENRETGVDINDAESNAQITEFFEDMLGDTQLAELVVRTPNWRMSYFNSADAIALRLIEEIY